MNLNESHESTSKTFYCLHERNELLPNYKKKKKIAKNQVSESSRLFERKIYAGFGMLKIEIGF